MDFTEQGAPFGENSSFLDQVLLDLHNQIYNHRKRELIQHLYPQQISYILAEAHKFLDWFLFYCTRRARSVSLSKIAAKKETTKIPDRVKIQSKNTSTPCNYFVISKQKDILTTPIKKGTPEYMACIEGHTSTPCNCHF